jgi:hypothetical protein
MRALLKAATNELHERLDATLTSVLATRGAYAAFLRAGFQAHVPKPADPEELVTVLASVVKRL